MQKGYMMVYVICVSDILNKINECWFCAIETLNNGEHWLLTKTVVFWNFILGCAK